MPESDPPSARPDKRHPRASNGSSGPAGSSTIARCQRGCSRMLRLCRTRGSGGSGMHEAKFAPIFATRPLSNRSRATTQVVAAEPCPAGLPRIPAGLPGLDRAARRRSRAPVDEVNAASQHRGNRPGIWPRHPSMKLRESPIDVGRLDRKTPVRVRPSRTGLMQPRNPRGSAGAPYC